MRPAQLETLRTLPQVATTNFLIREQLSSCQDLWIKIFSLIRVSILVQGGALRAPLAGSFPHTAGQGGHAGWRPVPPPGSDDGEQLPP